MTTQIHWQPVFDEALDYFIQYLQINTTNPPGNEKPAARWLGNILADEPAWRSSTSRSSPSARRSSPGCAATAPSAR